MNFNQCHKERARIARNIFKSYNSLEESSDVLEKGGKRAQIGEKRMFGGREYIKTPDGWKYHGKGTGTKAQEHDTSPIKLAEQKGVHTNYNPHERVHGTTSTNRRLSEFEGVDGNKIITVYRGIDGDGEGIRNGDYVTPSKQLAQDYAGTGKVVSMQVKMQDLLADDSDFDIEDFETAEFIYSKK